MGCSLVASGGFVFTYLELSASILQCLLACRAEWAGGLGEDQHGVLVDEGLGLLLCGCGHVD